MSHFYLHPTKPHGGLTRCLRGKEYQLPGQGTQETWVRFLVWKDSPEGGHALQCSCTPEIPWTEEPGRGRGPV